MIGYPFDSHVEYDEHDMPEFDRAVSSKPLKNLIAKLFSNGVLPNPSTNLQVVSGGDGMTVIVKAGFCIINGGLKLEDEDKTLVVQASDNTNPRIDTVVMRWNDNDDVRACDLYIVEGTPSASPVRPNLTRSESIYEIGLADIYITARSTSIDSFRITDTRLDTARCGYISSISEFDTSTLYAQIQSDLSNFQSEEQADFLAWFEAMRDQLSEDAAGHLQLEIDEVNGRYNGLTQDIDGWKVLNQLPAVGIEKTLYFITGEEESHYAGDVGDDDSVINDSVISTDKTFSSSKVSTLLGTKVDAEAGKGLSSNDYTNTEKNRVAQAIIQIKTINGQDLRGSGNIQIESGGTSVVANPSLSGGEINLNSLGVGATKFKLVSEPVIQAIYNLLKIAVFSSSPNPSDFTTIENYLNSSTKILNSIAASKTNTIYQIGDILNVSDITAVAYYADASVRDISALATIDASDVNMNAAGNYNINVSYMENGVTKTTTIPITVSAAPSRAVTILGAFESGALPNPQGTPSTNENACYLQNVSLQNGQKIGFKDLSAYASYKFAFGYRNYSSSWIKDPNNSNYWTSDASVADTKDTYGIMILHLKVNDQSIPITAEDIAYINQNFGIITEA